MSEAIQLDFFKSQSELELEELLSEIKTLRESNERVRKRLFADINQLRSEYTNIKEEFTAWKSTLNKLKV